MAFKSKIKSKLKLLNDERQTVDAKHNNVLNSFNDQKTYIPALREELSIIIKDILKLKICLKPLSKLLFKKFF